MKPVLSAIIVAAAGVLLLAAIGGGPVTAAQLCASIASLKVPDTRIAMAQVVSAGTFSSSAPFQPPPPGAGISAVPFKDLPEFCRVTAFVNPVKDSEIGFELWMPTANWNGKFMGVGNGGFGGMISAAALTAPLARGYATASTDTGHQYMGRNTPEFALGHREKLIDYAYRAVHEMTVKAKAIVEAYYGQRPKLAYWYGCSLGGRQGLTEAQRFPADFDGIVVGAPANFMTHLNAGAVWKKHAIDKTPAGVMPPAKLALLHDAVLAACDDRDGVKDKMLEDPKRCDFDPKALECKGADSPSCLTTAQVELARAFYGPAVNPRTKEIIFPGYALGSERGWDMAQNIYGRGDFFKYALFQDASWDYSAFDFDADLARADQADNGLTSSTDPDLRPFFGRGGKLLHFHGWGDPDVTPFNSVNYYQSVVDLIGGPNVRDSYRLFMVPGMAHCGGGDGLNRFDAIREIEQWVEGRQPPNRIIATRVTDGHLDRTHPLCPYPQVAEYKGTGSTDDPLNFVCRLP
jgi:feruloyl esterase